jgi:hypothetical protein
MAAGKKTGGRRKGTPNRRTAEMRAEISATGELPLDYMLRVMRDPLESPARRDLMAWKAAPYLHPQLAAVAHRVSGPDGGPVGSQFAPAFSQTIT